MDEVRLDRASALLLLTQSMVQHHFFSGGGLDQEYDYSSVTIRCASWGYRGEYRLGFRGRVGVGRP